MAQHGLLILAIIVALGGCGAKSAKPPTPGIAATPAKPPVAATPAKPPTPGIAATPAKPPVAATPSKTHAPDVDGFGLPLVIVMHPPEVPKEIQGPSRPKAPPEPAKKRPWWMPSKP